MNGICLNCQRYNWSERDDRWVCRDCLHSQAKIFFVPGHISKIQLFQRQGLTFIQAQIADMLRHGFKHKMVAALLGISETGVLRHFKEVRRILNVNKKELVKLWRNGER